MALTNREKYLYVMGQISMIGVFGGAKYPLPKVALACSQLSMDAEKTLLPGNTLLDTAKILEEIKDSHVDDVLSQKIDELLHDIEMAKARKQ